MKKDEFIQKCNHWRNRYNVFMFTSLVLFLVAVVIVTPLQHYILSEGVRSFIVIGLFVSLAVTFSWRSKRLEKELACPICEKGITGLKINMTIATDRCPNCGEQIIEK